MISFSKNALLWQVAIGKHASFLFIFPTHINNVERVKQGLLIISGKPDQAYHCGICPYDAPNRTKWIRHINTLKHKTAMKDQPSSPESSGDFLDFSPSYH